MNKLLKNINVLRIVILILVGLLLALWLEGDIHGVEILRKYATEFVIVITAAIAVSMYFEHKTRSEISEEFTKFIEQKEEFGKAGIIKYYSNFKDINIRDFFNRDIKQVDFYVNFAHTVFNNLQDSISKFCEKKDVQLTVYLLAKDNKFIDGLGALWGTENPEYNPEGISRKIDSSLNTLTTTFDNLKRNGKLHAKIKIVLLKKNPVFYSFYRFDDEMVYVPSKIVEPKSFVPLAFIVKRTTTVEGIFNKCVEELAIINNNSTALEIVYEN